MDNPLSESATLAVIQQVKADYTRFPKAQSYHIYAQDVYFKDPMNEFRGVERYQRMIGFIEQWFHDIDLKLHGIEQPQTDRFITRWTLQFTAPTPWQPRISIPGWSELQLNQAGLICSHIDYWNCSRWSVLKQVFSP
ncbi:hypothetical protein N836_09920 [Leptolyngbya sp. Heron Island J]|uniref:DUF2358 domain-containing protein n=1 Tax=Leptolyngbya sp. Heron Island J TaxID=1385935 RepID=UPI0003B97650|nr:DUF2358 domain-containing protein [Leptolyngbya sp. Heron Island J]ESA35835.1 hypothetical protein N836_09920 [Leptolyngbya sp. Heron Island J]